MIIRLIVLLLLTIGSTLIHGKMTYRWGVSDEMKQYDDHVKSIPAQLGAWKHVSDGKAMSEGVVSELGVTEYVSRVYTNGKDSVTLLLMSGKTGRLIRHTPDICYGASGNEFLKQPTQVSLDIDGKQHEFKVLPIRPTSELNGNFVVVYGFARDGQFQSPDRPRLTFHGTTAIEKIQVLCELKSDGETEQDKEKLGQIPEYATSFIEEICRYMQTSASAGESKK